MHRGGAGWRRANRLASYVLLPAASLKPESACELPLDMGEKSAIVKSVDANVPPDQPPSTVDSPATLILWRGLSATGITFETPTSPSSTQASVTSPGCGVTPYGLTY
jgi:hypothetical protein